MKKIIVALMAVSMIFAMFGCGDSESEATEPTASSAETTQNSTKQASLEKEIKTALVNNLGEGESIKDVVLTDGDLCIYIDFSKVDPSPLTLEDLAISRTSSVTDTILGLSQYESSWDTITVDFGDIGHITNSKKDIQTNEYGMSYFPSDDFKLE